MRLFVGSVSLPDPSLLGLYVGFGALVAAYLLVNKLD
jgi:hypothetical protein